MAIWSFSTLTKYSNWMKRDVINEIRFESMGTAREGDFQCIIISYTEEIEYLLSQLHVCTCTDGISATELFHGTFNGNIFSDYLRESLIPEMLLFYVVSVWSVYWL